MQRSMKITDYKSKASGKYVVCLGRFESLHLGHRAIISNALNMAGSLGAEVMLMTYDEGDNARFKPLIVDFNERLRIAEELGVGAVLRVEFCESFIQTPAEEFLNTLWESFSVAGVCCGFDFRYGHGREGNTESLERFCKEKNIPLSVAERVETNGQKIASSAIKGLILSGSIAEANGMLGYRYFYTGTVTEGRREGTKLGFATANTLWQDGRVMPKRGVYATRSVIGGRLYRGITNVGAAPTFGVLNDLVETHFIGFDGDLYGSEITVCFDKFLREQKKFASVGELKLQLEADLRAVIDNDQIRTER